ncbi:MAG: TauD/TfdA family dioxygenase [Pyrinomonadaceae bacterium]
MSFNEKAQFFDPETLADRHLWAIPFDDDYAALATELTSRIDQGFGFAVVVDVPMEDITPTEAQRLAVDMLKNIGEPLLQGTIGDQTAGWLVRNEGVSRFDGDERYQPGVYTSKSPDHLDIHNDAAMQAYGNNPDYFALLTYRRAKHGGESILVSSHAIYSILSRENPKALQRLMKPFAFERQHVTHPGQEPVSWGPVFHRTQGKLRVRWNRQRIEMAPSLTGVPLTKNDLTALDAFEEVACRPKIQFRYLLQKGECLVVNDHAVLHGRSGFVDGGEPHERRCLVRVLLKRKP